MRLLLVAAAIVLTTPGVQAASLGETMLTSYRDMHRDTDFGTWFLQVGAFRAREGRDMRNFKEIVGSGEIEGLPGQRGYCFVMNNFDPDREGGPETLNITLTKKGNLPIDGGFVEESVEVMSPIAYYVTSDVTSRKLVIFCVSALTGVETLEIEVDGTDDAADRSWHVQR